MNATELKNVRSIRCKTCTEPVAEIDVHTWDGFYYCEDCFNKLASAHLSENSLETIIETNRSRK